MNESTGLVVIHPCESYDLDRSAASAITSLIGSGSFNPVHVVHSLAGPDRGTYAHSPSFSLSVNGALSEDALTAIERCDSIVIAGGFLDQCFRSAVESMLRARPTLDQLIFPLDAIYTDLSSIGWDDRYGEIPIDPLIIRSHAHRSRVQNPGLYTTTLATLLHAAQTKDTMRDLLKDYANRFFNLPFPLESRFETLFGQACIVHSKRVESTQSYRSTMGY